MAEADDIQPIVCDNGTGMVKVSYLSLYSLYQIFGMFSFDGFIFSVCRLVLPVMMLPGLFSLVLLVGQGIMVSWLG